MAATNKIKNELFGQYILTRFVLLYMLRLILENDITGKMAIQTPGDFVRDAVKRRRFRACIDKVTDDIVVDVNAEVENLGEDFDYRGKLRDEDWVKNLGKEVITSYQKVVNRNRILSLHKEWAASNK